MSDPKKDHSAIIQQHIRELDSHLFESESFVDPDVLMSLAYEYASEHPDDYYLALPGIILPIFT